MKAKPKETPETMYSSTNSSQEMPTAKKNKRIKKKCFIDSAKSD